MRIDHIKVPPKLLKKLLKSIDDVDFIYSQSPRRAEIIQNFREGKIRILITTTILERGVTFPNLNVIVWQADSQIFDSATLIQIAGRVGRSKDYTGGEVIFLYKLKTKQMEQAKKYIVEMKCKLSNQSSY